MGDIGAASEVTIRPADFAQVDRDGSEHRGSGDCSSVVGVSCSQIVATVAALLGEDLRAAPQRFSGFRLWPKELRNAICVTILHQAVFAGG